MSNKTKFWIIFAVIFLGALIANFIYSQSLSCSGQEIDLVILYILSLAFGLIGALISNKLFK